MDSLLISRNFQIVVELLRVWPIPWLIPLHGSSGQRHATDPVRAALTSCATRAWRLEHSKGVASRQEKLIKVTLKLVLSWLWWNRIYEMLGREVLLDKSEIFFYKWELNEKCKEPLLVELWSSSLMHVVPIMLARTWDPHPPRRLLPDTNSFCIPINKYV